MTIIDLTSPFNVSRCTFFLSSIYFIIAGKTLEFPDQINILSIFFKSWDGKEEISDSSNYNKIIGFFGYNFLIFFDKSIGFISEMRSIIIIKSNDRLASMEIASHAVDAFHSLGA